MSKLAIAPELNLPVDAVTQTFAILAKRGVGKTHTATVMAEEMLQIGQPIVVYDPTSAWWGLKSSKDGKRPGYPVVIFGGEHADVPLEENAGETIATVIVEKRIPAVLDVGLLRKGARVRFMADFCEVLYHKNREALHFFCDEAHTIAPQAIYGKDLNSARLLGAMEDIVLQGRRRGLGVTVISQRPALVNKNCTTQCEVLIAMQLTGSHDRKAIQEWVDVHGDDEAQAKAMLSSLSSLQRGEAWVWSPGWLRKLVRVTFRDRTTFDSSATPKVGGRPITPKSVAAVDLAALGDQIRATVEKAKADDPKELRRQLADLQKQLAAKPTVVVPPKTIEKPVITDQQLKRLEKLVHQLSDVRQGLAAAIDELAPSLRKVVTPNPLPQPVARTAPPKPVPSPRQREMTFAPKQPTAATDGVVSDRAKRFLDAAATLSALDAEVTRESVCGWLGIHPRGGSVGEILAELRDGGLFLVDRGHITVTDAGMSAATMLDTAAAIDSAKAGLTERQERFFTVICNAYPHDVTREQIAAEFNLHPRGGSLGEDLSRLKGRGLIEGDRGRYRARDFLFAGR